MRKSKAKTVFKRVIGFFLAFVLAFTALSMLFSAVVFHILFHRTDDLSGYAVIGYSMLDSSAYARQRVSFLSGSNTLRGYLYAADKPHALVIIAPGLHSNSESHLAEMMYFVDHGYSVLTYDATGVCESDGDSTVGLQQSKLDVLSAVTYASGEPSLQKLPVILYGHSLGGYAAAAALSEGKVAAAICISGFNSPVETMKRKAQDYVGVFADIQYPFLYLQNVFTFGENADATALDALNTTDTPVLICGGASDETIPYDISLYARRKEISNRRVDSLSVDEPYRNGHTNLWLSRDSARYMAQLQQQLDDLSAACGGTIPSEALDRFYSGVDPKKATVLDEGFMQTVLSFCEKSLAR